MALPSNALIVDDEPHVRTFLRLLLREVGVTECWEATDGGQALAMALHHQPELILLDINLPVMSGLEVLDQLRAAKCESPVIMVTSQSAMKSVLESARLGAIGYILKHSPKDQALTTLRETLARLEDEPEENVDGRI